MRLDHLLSREQAKWKHGASSIGRLRERELTRKENRTTRNRESKQEMTVSLLSVSFSGSSILSRGSTAAHLDNRTKNEMTRKVKTSCKKVRQIWHKPKEPTIYRKNVVGLRIQEHARACKEIKRRRAQGGCQGTKRRRRTWQAAKSTEEPQAGIDSVISEWGNPIERSSMTHR